MSVIEERHLIFKLQQDIESYQKELEDMRAYTDKLERQFKLMDHFFLMVGNHRLKLERTLIQHGIPLPPYSCKED